MLGQSDNFGFIFRTPNRKSALLRFLPCTWVSSNVWYSISVLTRASLPSAHAYISGVIPWSFGKRKQRLFIMDLQIREYTYQSTNLLGKNSVCLIWTTIIFNKYSAGTYHCDYFCIGYLLRKGAACCFSFLFLFFYTFFLISAVHLTGYSITRWQSLTFYLYVDSVDFFRSQHCKSLRYYVTSSA